MQRIPQKATVNENDRRPLSLFLIDERDTVNAGLLDLRNVGRPSLAAWHRGRLASKEDAEARD